MTRYDEYNDKIDDIMSFVIADLNNKGFRLKIRSREDLKLALVNLDKNRKKQHEQPKFTNAFLDKVTDAQRADFYVGKTLGGRGRVRQFKKTRLERTKPKSIPQRQNIITQRVIVLRQRGRTVQRVKDDFVAKERLTRDKKFYIAYRSVKTGRFTKKPVGDK